MCTGVRFTGGNGGMFLGRNYDWCMSYGERVVVVPRGFPVSYRFAGDAPCAHAMVGTAVDLDNYPLFFDAGNDAGLAVAGLNFPGFAEYAEGPVEGKVGVAAYEFPLWVCASFSTVDEVEAALRDAAIVGVAPAEGMGVSYLHWIIGDETRSVVVESRADGMHVLDDPVDVLTNQPTLEWQLENLRGYVTVGNDFPEPGQWGPVELRPYGAGAGMRGIPGDCYSPSRFVKAAFLNTHYPAKGTEAENVTRMFRTLEGTAMVEGCTRMGNGDYEKTLYSCCFSGATGRYYYNTYDDPAIRFVELSSAEGRPADRLLCPEPRLERDCR